MLNLLVTFLFLFIYIFLVGFLCCVLSNLSLFYIDFVCVLGSVEQCKQAVNFLDNGLRLGIFISLSILAGWVCYECWRLIGWAWVAAHI